LEYTISYYHINEITSFLLESEFIDVNAKNKKGETAVHWAARRGSNEILQLLYYRGADFNVQTDIGETAIGKAIINGRGNTVQVLLAGGAGVNAQIKLEVTALYEAVRNQDEEMVLDKSAGNKQENEQKNNMQSLLKLGANSSTKINMTKPNLHQSALGGKKWALLIGVESFLEDEAQTTRDSPKFKNLKWPVNNVT
jgi:ankyrin repeat protein